MLAVTVTVRPRKQPCFAIFQDLVIEMKRDARHGTFVLFMRAINIEVTQADHLAIRRRRHAPYIPVELKLGIAVDVQRIFE